MKNDNNDTNNIRKSKIIGVIFFSILGYFSGYFIPLAIPIMISSLWQQFGGYMVELTVGKCFMNYFSNKFCLRKLNPL